MFHLRARGGRKLTRLFFYIEVDKTIEDGLLSQSKFARVFGAIDSPLGSKLYPTLFIYPPILGSKKLLQISLTNNVVCPTYTHYSRWF